MVWAFGPNGVPAEIEAIVDTGFSGALALPFRIIERLQFDSKGMRDAVVAAGRRIQFEQFSGIVRWQGQERVVDILGTEGVSLIGMSLLRGSELRMMVEDAGEIEITPFDEL